MGVSNPNIPGNAETATLAADAVELQTASGAAPSYAARAWVNFNAIGTVTIADSGNVSSVTDNGAGDFTVNFALAMTSANYAVYGSGSTGAIGTGARAVWASDAAKLAASCRIFCAYAGAPTSGQDCAQMSAVFMH